MFVFVNNLGLSLLLLPSSANLISTRRIKSTAATIHGTTDNIYGTKQILLVMMGGKVLFGYQTCES
jgi:hypothetical protein